MLEKHDFLNIRTEVSNKKLYDRPVDKQALKEFDALHQM
jgi:hypothetical protein